MYCIAVLGLTFTTTILSVIKICPDDDKMFTPGYHCDNNYWSVPLCLCAGLPVVMLSHSIKGQPDPPSTDIGNEK